MTATVKPRPGPVPRSAGRPRPWRPSARHRRLAWIGDAVGTLAIVSVVIVVLLWLAGGNVNVFRQVGGPMTALGRLTGLVASDFLLLQVLLMARIPWVEQVWGHGGLARKHRWLGFTSFWMMIVHIVLITIGYAQASHVNLVAELWDLTIHYAGMLLAAAGTLALIMVVVTSIRRARRKMRYESWHLIHLYSYLGVGLALPHQLWTGADFRSSPWATVYWWTLWAAAIGAVIVFRLVYPLLSSLRHRLVVTSVRREGPGVFSVTMGGNRLDRMGLQPGQFCQWRFLHGAGWTRAQPFSVSNVPTAHSLRITVQQVGDGSDRLANARPGTRVLFEGPYGTMTADRRTRRDVLLIGSGVGITPLRGLAEMINSERISSRRAAPSVVVIQRTRSIEETLFVQEFTALARQGVRVIPLIGRRGPASEWFPGPGVVSATNALRRLVPDVADREIYLCGPRAWTHQVKRTLHDLHVPASAIHTEDFAG
ncbi:Predicted ferric reductase [Nakamurella panacisegetis]|uniref:Predicted ferric reductase n=1 Tax=Nakamurella panacisegetis TaxID=1090615 RepID=A0A1H0KZX5_9ACTN|nr:ferredoxin reductase family protein [Nakamurella panacisegetis]SDO61343.1 Predicted ferric reductase [Nakamurella panacisegetis]